VIREQPITAAQKALHRRWWLLTPLYILLLLIAIIGIVGAVAGVILLWQLGQNRTPHYADIVEEFKYGSIGAEPHSGIPYPIWRVLPTLFPEVFEHRDDYSAFGFLYENSPNGRQRDRLVQLRDLPHRHRERDDD